MLLVALAMSAGRTVSSERLVAALWSDELPINSRRSLHTYMCRLRTVVGDGWVETRPAGFALRTDPDNVDALRFARLLDEAASIRDADGQRRLLDEALGLWRGDPFEGVTSRWLEETETPRLTERYLAALERRFDLDLADARHAELAARLTKLTARYPLREPLWVRLLVVLDRCGRRAEALEQYEQIRLRIADELGSDPGAELQRVHGDLLAGRPTDAAVAPPAAPVPRQLPADVPAFVGRPAELAALGGVDDSPALAIAVIDGMAGVGKTALAVHCAHRLALRYPDGQIFVDLHGFTDGVGPVQPGDALDRILRALGVPSEQIPGDLDERAALYRSHLAGRRVLILLDNAAADTQVAPLLPGTSGCLVLITSRRRLAGLDQTHSISLDVLPPSDAVTLFARTVGGRQLSDEYPLTEIAELCGRLPLAIRIAAARLRTRPAWTAADLADRLRDHQHRLAELEVGRRSMTAALSLSYQQLTTAQQAAYRLLGLHPGADIDTHAAAALTHSTVEQARRLLGHLLDVHLLLEPIPGRYRFHDLVRSHAADMATQQDTAPLRRAALTRLFAHYADTATVAMDAAYPYERDRRPRLRPTGWSIPPLDDPKEAAAWLDTELLNLLATTQYAADHGWQAHTLHLAATLQRHLVTRGLFTQADRLCRCALRLARAAGNDTAQLNALAGLGDVLKLQGRHDQAIDSYQRALDIARSVADGAGQARALCGLGEIHYLQSRYDTAGEYFRPALEVARSIADGTGQLDALRGLGWLHRLQNLPEQAANDLTQALSLARSTGNRIGEFHATSGLGHLHLAERRFRAAGQYFEQALAVARDIGHRTCELDALCGLGHVHRAMNRNRDAVDTYQQVLDIARQIGIRNWQFEALHGMGRAYTAAGQPDQAVTCHVQALDLATDLGQLADQVRAHDGLAHDYRSQNLDEDARRHWQQALDILTRLGTDRTEEEGTGTLAIRAHLADMTGIPAG